MTYKPTISYLDLPHFANTDASGANRYERRIENMFSKNRRLIEGKRVLDLACFTGHMSYANLMLGATSATGVEIRQNLIEDGKKAFAGSEHEDKMTFIQSDIFEFLKDVEPGEYDVILCLGFLYHTVNHIEFFRQMKRLQPETVIIDTNVAKNYLWFGRRMFGKPAALFVTVEDANLDRNTTDLDGIVYWPSCSYLEDMLKLGGFKPAFIDFRKDGSSNWAAMSDYKKGTRAAYVGTRL